ncbi:hypothetical protein RI129_000425 [Pyrocoelia pectoralis]|uniref:Uncharacterized protein n=1 Tax=Pyrocoelia pectoralis TaxID=417401 RepID=A0AAN7VS99_9COLE
MQSENKNNNGHRLLQLCTENNLIIMNTFFIHKDIHKYTREAPSRNEKSIIDYIVINKSFRKEIKDVKVRRGAEIYSDHYLVIAKIHLKTKAVETIKSIKHKKKAIRVYKLKEKKVWAEFGKQVEEKLEADSKQYE